MRDLKRLLILLAVAITAAALTGWLHPRAPTLDRQAVAEITLEAASKMEPSRVLWIDARSREAFLRRHIPGAILVNEEEWDRTLAGFVEAWQPGQLVIVYCDSSKCHASASVARRLERELDLSTVRVLQGGWEAWIASGGKER